MAVRLSRRELLVGVASAAMLPTSARSEQLQVSDLQPYDDLVAIGLQFWQLVERTLVLEQQKVRLASSSTGLNSDAAYQHTWKAWSDSIDDAETLANLIRRRPAQSLADLSLKFDALLWDISHDGPDEGSIEKLQGWGEEFRQLAGSVVPVDTHS